MLQDYDSDPFFLRFTLMSLFQQIFKLYQKKVGES